MERNTRIRLTFKTLQFIILFSIIKYKGFEIMNFKMDLYQCQREN